MKLSLIFPAFSSACSDSSAADLCTSDCTGKLFICQANCSTNDCNAQCESEFKECTNDCPCGRSCPQGCEACPSKYCYDPDLKTVVLGQRYNSNKLMASYMISEDSISNVTSFSPAENSIYSADSVFFKDEIWIFGGYPDGNKISILRGCEFETLPTRLQNWFSTEYHSSAVLDEKVWLCFGDFYACEIFDGESSVIDERRLNQPRQNGAAVGVYGGQLVAVGESGPSRGKTELREEQWREIDDHPIDISYTSLISFKTGVLTVGGVTRRIDGSNEDEYEPIKGIYALQNFIWSHIGDLQHANMLSKAALNGNELIFIPGLKAPWLVQKLNWNGEIFEMKDIYETGMQGYVTYPSLFDARASSCEIL